MSPSDEQLRRALEPLAGDPAADARRVVAVLREGPAAAAAAPRRAWRPSALAGAAGLLIGALGAHFGAGTDAPIEQPAEPPAELPTEPAADADTDELRAAGEVVIQSGDAWIEDGDARQPLRVTSALPSGHLVVVAANAPHVGPAHENVLVARLDGGASLRVRGGSRLRLAGPRSISLLDGELAVVPAGDSDDRFVVETVAGTVTGAGAAFQVRVSDDETRVLALSGEVVFVDFTGNRHPVPADGAVSCSAGLVTSVEPPPLRWPEVAWHAHAMHRCGHGAGEAIDRALELVGALDDPARAEAATDHLLAAGDLAEATLLTAILAPGIFDETATDEAALLLPRVATRRSLQVLLVMLTEQSPDLRVTAFRAVERLTGVTADTDETFWSEAPPADRHDAVRRLRELLDTF